MHIQHTGGDAGLGKLCGGVHGQAHGVAVGDDGHVLAVLDLVGLADGEFHVLVVDLGHRVAGEAQVHGAVSLGGLTDQLAGGVVVRGHNHRHVGDGAQDAHVLDGLVGRAVVGGSHAAVGAGDLHVQIGVADLLADHLAHAQGAEHGVGHHEGDLSAGGQPGGEAGAVLLGDAHVDVLVRQGLTEFAGLAALADVDIDHDQIGVLFAQLRDLLAEAVAGGDHFLLTHCSLLLP